MAQDEISKFAVVAKLTASEGNRDALIEVLRAALDNAEDEPGTLVYLLHEDTGDADSVWFYEMYVDRDAHRAHVESEGFKALGPALRPYLAGRPEITYLQPVGGKGI